MKTIFYLCFLLLPISCFGQFSITGRLLNQAETKPLPNVSIFLSNTTIGNKTSGDGTFTLKGVAPGKYDLVISMVGFETLTESVTIAAADVKLPDILLFPKTIALKEVKVKFHDDPDRDKYYGWFKDQFIGTSENAQNCKILNPEVLDFDYNENTATLNVTAEDFLVIRNEALGYQVKYLVKNFSLVNVNKQNEKVYYQGPVAFEELKGTASDERRWKNRRSAVFENSPIHFLRAVLNNRINEEGFRVQQYAIYANPERPGEEVIKNKIAFYKQGGGNADSLSYWVKKSKLPKTLSKLMPYALTSQDIAKPSDKPGIYVLNCDNDGLYVAYNRNHHFHVSGHVAYLDNSNNTENTLIKFEETGVLFSANGVIQNPYSIILYGAWGKSRVADLLPTDYEPAQAGGVEASPVFSDNITAKLDSFIVRHPVEKAYLQFDKPYYAAGDTLYFKAYVTLGDVHKLSGLSGLLHVDLINTKNKIDRSVQLHLDTGLAWGDFALPDSLPQGCYRVRAYTQWMRNAPDPDFFEKTITIAALKAPKVPEAGARHEKQDTHPDVQFFPEGGSLVAGLPAKIAFKAIGPDGMGIGVRGMVTDASGGQITSFASEHLGMGYFYLTLVAGESYSAKITYPDGKQDIIPLQKSSAEGISLTVDNDSLPKATIKIAASQGYFNSNKGKNYTLLVSSGCVVATMNCPLDSPIIKIDVLKRRLRTGVATVTLFSPGNEPLCERLFFIQNYDQLSLSLSVDKQTYTPREKASIKLNVLNRRGKAAEGHFSVSVVDETKAPDNDANAGNILSNLLLTSDLKGYVEQPGYYFSDTAGRLRKDLDVLMLTQGYRGFEWRQVLDSANRSPSYQPENGITLAGRVTSLSDNPVTSGTVTLIPLGGGQLLNTTTDANGDFRFSNLLFTDTGHFILNAVNANNKNSTQIKLTSDTMPVHPAVLQFSRAVPDLTLAGYVSNDKIQQQATLNYLISKGIMLKPVNIRDRKPDDQYRTLSLAGAGHADQVMHMDEIEQVQGSLATSLNGRLMEVTFVQVNQPPEWRAYLTLNLHTGNSPSPMLIIIDGGQAPPESINYLMASDVETVEVLRNSSASIYGMQGGGGVLIITTRQGGGLNPKDVVAKGVLPISPIGFYKAREFYSPKYDHPNDKSDRPDLRSTIYWQPELKTDTAGNALFEYYNADGKGTYKVTIEGIDKDGAIGRVIYRYKVE